MFKVNSNIEQIINIQLKTLDQLADADKVLREAAFNTVAIISHRVQQEGKAINGEQIKSTSKKKYNAYSYGYGKKRNKEGYQTEKIDLTFSGDMMGDFLPAPEDKTSYVVGFRGKTASDKADWNERRFGKIFELSKAESDLIGGIISKKVNEILNRQS